MAPDKNTLIGNIEVRIFRSSDALPLTDSYLRNREHLAPWEPHRTADTLTGIVLGPFCSAHVGSWVDQEYSGRGIGSAALEHALAFATKELGLHRVQAATLLHNAASRKILHRAGFERIGMAPAYLTIAGAWQDHNLYQRILY